MPVIPIVTAVAARLNGQAGAYLQANWSYGRNDSGPFQSFNYEGTAAEVEALGPLFDAAGWTWTVTGLNASRAKLEAHAGFAGGTDYTVVVETPENIWEMEAQEVQKELLEADFPFGMSLSTITKEDKVLIGKVAADDTLDYDGMLNELNDNLSNGANLDTAVSLVLILKAGVRAFPVEASIIRHTQLVSNLYSVKASYTNCNRILSTASMTSVEGVPGNLLFNVPTTPTPSQFIESAGDLQYGWRKLRPAITRLAQFKWRILQNYQFGLWAVRLYGLVI